METIILEHEGTGGNCTAYTYYYGKDKSNFIMLVDDMKAPKNINAFPYAVVSFMEHDYDDSCEAESMADVLSFISKVLNREISVIKAVK